MSISDRLGEALRIDPAFTFSVGEHEIAITETVVVSWAVMAICVIGALWWRSRLEEAPRGKQVFLECAVDFINRFSGEQLGKYGKVFSWYMGTLFMFILGMNLIPVLSPISGFGFTAPFDVKPPTRDINVTAALAITTIVMTIASGIATRGFGGWVKTLFEPMPFMLPFNILDYVTKPLSLCLRLFGNMLAAFIIVTMVETAVPAIVPIPVSAYFDWFDGTLQAVVFTFLTMIYISEALAAVENK